MDYLVRSNGRRVSAEAEKESSIFGEVTKDLAATSLHHRPRIPEAPKNHQAPILVSMASNRCLRLSALPSELRQSVFASLRRPYSTQTSPTPSSSVSSTETSHFSALASSWWDPQGPSRILHLMNPLRHTFINRCLANTIRSQTPDRKLTYLDIGCGGGIFAESAARLPSTRSVRAIDPTPSVIEVAKQHQRTDPSLLAPGRLSYLNSALEDLRLPKTPEEGVDVLSLFEVIEHIQRPAPFLDMCLAHVRPGGWLVLSTISRTWTSWFTTKFVAEEVMRVVPSGTHDWNQYINVDEMKSWAKSRQGWGDVRVMGVIYVPGVGWREVKGSESWGNYFFAVRRLE